MGKSKRQKLNSSKGSKANTHKLKGPPTKASSNQKPSSSKRSPSQVPSKSHAPKTSRSRLPFAPNDTILLIGEGDLSFARSLIAHHGCTSLIASVFESSPDLIAKYPAVADQPGVAENVKAIEEGGGMVKYGVDASKMGLWSKDGKEKKRSAGAGRGRGMGENGIDRVIFNFPHVGGKSTDVNRQVRYNQELLVSFFDHAIPSLSSRYGSSITVTLFAGAPYDLWNIRDLARHAGLEVERSWQFDAGQYPGYRHARTLGVVKGKGGERAGWKGEDREARSFSFVRKGEGVKQGEGRQAKRKRLEEDDEEDEGDEASSEAEYDFEEEEKVEETEGEDVEEDQDSIDANAAKEDSPSESSFNGFGDDLAPASTLKGVLKKTPSLDSDV